MSASTAAARPGRPNRRKIESYRHQSTLIPKSVYLRFPDAKAATHHAREERPNQDPARPTCSPTEDRASLTSRCTDLTGTPRDHSHATTTGCRIQIP